MVSSCTKCTDAEFVSDGVTKSPVFSSFTSGNMEYVHLTPEEAERLFRRAFGGFSLDEIFRNAFEQNVTSGRNFGTPAWRAGRPSMRMNNAARADFLSEADILEILRDTFGECSTHAYGVVVQHVLYALRRLFYVRHLQSLNPKLEQRTFVVTAE